MLSVTSVVELIEVVVDIFWVVLTESNMLLTVELDEAASAGKTKQKKLVFKLAFEYA